MIPPPQPSVPDIVVRARRTLPVIWIIPLVAAVVAGSMWYEAVRERGPEIVIHFETASGLDGGKTRLRVKDVSVGVVSSIALNDDLSGVTVTARMERGTEPYLRDSTRFWVVRPSFGLGGISGLETVVSGAYIEMDPGASGEPTTTFTGLETPPLSPVDAPGLQVTLLADGKGSLDVGSYVYHRQIEVGRVEGVRWVDGLQGVAFDVYIEAPFADLVRANTRFWNVSGVRVSLGADGLAVQTESLDSLLGGGVAFGLPDDEPPSAAAPSGSVFTVHPDEAAAQDVRGVRHDFVLSFRESARGLAVGAPVEFRGIRVGVVRRVAVELDAATMQASMVVNVEIEPARLGVVNGPEGELDERRELLGELVERGLRARLQTGNLLTGSLFVEFVLAPTSPIVLARDEGDGLPEIPTVPSTRATLGDTLAMLPDLVDDLSRSADALAGILGSPELPETFSALSVTARDLSTLIARLQGDVPDAVTDLRAATRDLRATLEAAQQTLGVLTSRGDDVGAQLQRTLVDVSAAVDAFGRLADYLERHPEAILSGK